MMKLWRYAILLPVFILTAAVSCKDKDEEEDTNEYLSGSLSYDMPMYVKYGDVVHIVPEGVYRGSDKTDDMLSYSWYNPITNRTDTIRLENDSELKSKEFDFVIDKDTLATFTMTVRIWADGYYAKSASRSFTVVDPELETGSLRGFGDLSSTPFIIDPRDNAVYYYFSAGGRDWMSRNLFVETAGKPFEDADAMNSIFGRYYTWEEAQTACPAGWRLPTDAEFVEMAASAGGSASEAYGTISGAAGALMGDIYFNKSKLWEFWPTVTITNSTGFTSIPAGYAVVEDGSYSFKGFGSYAMYWTADDAGSGMAFQRYIYVDKPDIYCSAVDKKGIAASVRCVR